ncbi:MAG: DUF1467 family protein [Hyphomicrobiales bacterium]|nr:DUF1467 family protein [Hyphomicrobiales bacterium]MDE2113716.1 DUF1467 family protein [Hyphomicrobiales bacterium]
MNLFEPFGTVMGIAIYLTIWWMTLFSVLPFGVNSQSESPEFQQGTDPGAPAVPRLLRKALITTIISAVIFAGILIFTRYNH